MTNQEQMMYGMSTTDIDTQFKWMISSMGYEMTAISLLSDVQEIMARDPEQGRKWINVAKYILMKSMDQQKKAV